MRSAPTSAASPPCICFPGRKHRSLQAPAEAEPRSSRRNAEARTSLPFPEPAHRHLLSARSTSRWSCPAARPCSIAPWAGVPPWPLALAQTQQKRHSRWGRSRQHRALRSASVFPLLCPPPSQRRARVPLLCARPPLTLRPAAGRLHTHAPRSPSPSDTALVWAGQESHDDGGSQRQHRSNGWLARARVQLPLHRLRRAAGAAPGQDEGSSSTPQAPQPTVPTGSGKRPAKGNAPQHPPDTGKRERRCRIFLRCCILSARDGLKIRKRHEGDLFFK